MSLEDSFAKSSKNGGYYSQCIDYWNNVVCLLQKGEIKQSGDCTHTNWIKLTPEILVNQLICLV